MMAGVIGSILYPACVIFICLNVCNAIPLITGSGENVTVAAGSGVRFICPVIDTDPSQVTWSYDHHITISVGSQILNDAPNKYAIYVRTGEASRRQFILEIMRVEAADAGTYTCSVGKNTSISSSLYIIGAPVATPLPEAEIPSVNFTDCCVEQGVEAACLSHCVTGYTDFTDPASLTCLPHLSTLVECATDNRNHGPCCLRRNVPMSCLGYCTNHPDHSQVIGQLCVDHASDMILCAEEGHVLLPSEPRMVQAEPLSPEAIFLRWFTPIKNSDKVVGYRVFYKSESEDHYRSTSMITDAYNVLRVKPSTTYSMYVVAYSEHGSSQPSVTLLSAGLSGSDSGSGTDFNTCCHDQGVSEMCNKRFCSSSYSRDSDPSSFQCYREIDKIFTCLSGQGNHTWCCHTAGVPPECRPLCSGQVTDIGYEQVHCFSFAIISLVRSCVLQNTGLLPTAPRNFSVVDVRSDQATLVWEEPLQPNNVTSYLVRYQPYTDDNMQIDVSVSSSTRMLNLVDLSPGMRYKAMVFAVNAEGLSLSAPAVVFLTYFPTGVVPYVTTTVAPPTIDSSAELIGCCRDASVTDICQRFCSYDVDDFAVDAVVALSCAPEFGDILKCGANGRNHTSCCQERAVPSACLDFCAFDDSEEFQLDASHLQCLDSINSIIDCMQSGSGTIPSAPINVMVVNTTSTSISLSWSAPQRLPESIVYFVQFKQAGANTWKQVDTNLTHHILQNLPPGTAYSFQIMAHNLHGTSLPSPVLTQWTMREILSINVTTPADVTSCCREKNVNDSCIVGCQGGSALLDTDKCTGQLGKILECAADGRNHRQCCERYRVPSQCASYCEGRPHVTDLWSLTCLSFTQQILACFREGFDSLPSPPHNFHLVESGARQMKLAWEPPHKNGVPVKYILFYQPSYSSTFSQVEVLLNEFTLTDLTPHTLYTLYVIAINDAGRSLPSTTFQVWTHMEGRPSISITSVPDGNKALLGKKIVIICSEDMTEEAQDLSFYWLRNGQRVNNKVYTIESVAKEDTGRYTCVATNPDNVRASEDFILHVVYHPEVQTNKQSIGVEPYKQLTAHMVCSFKGYPDTISWFKDGVNIHQGHDNTNRYLTARIIHEDDGIIESHLTIAYVVKGDYGTYECSGTNSISSARSSIQLYNPSGDVDSGEVTPAPTVTNVTACCIEKGVTEGCMPACSFDIDLSALQFSSANGLDCLPDLPKIISCGADGADHSRCCHNNSVPDLCLPFCAGVVPSDIDTNHLVCIEHAETIVECMENGTKNLPGPPTNVRARLMEGSIRVWWDPPQTHPERVQTYTVYYSSPEDPNHSKTVSFRVRQVHLMSIHSLSTYTIYVTAGNHHGEGAASINVRVATQEMIPTAPRRLLASDVGPTYFFLQWEPPENYGGAVTSYIVCYEVVGETFYKQKPTSSILTRYNLTDLVSDTPYSIYVLAQSSHFSSPRSNIITAQTLSPVTRVLPQSGMSTGEKAGIGVGVTILVLMLIAIVVFVVFHFSYRKVPHSRFKESVAFENPGYATAGASRDGRISGLPGDSNKEVNKDVSRESAIMKEVESDAGYESLHHGNSTEPAHYATLDVSHAEKVDLSFDDGASGM